jgi:ADP-heptose:LPS heptosyltransferase
LVFQGYLVGDFFMALPALKKLNEHLHILVIARPDSLPFLKEQGILGLPFDNAFFIKPSLTSALRTLRSALALRKILNQSGSPGLPPLSGLALDMEADPRTAFWLKVMGMRFTVSWRRPLNQLFDFQFSLNATHQHQQERAQDVVQIFLTKRKIFETRIGVLLTPKRDFQSEIGAEPPAHADNQTTATTPASTLFSTTSASSSSSSSLPPTTSESSSRASSNASARERFATPKVNPSQTPPHSTWLVGVFTRKDVKNWPWERWHEWLRSEEASRLSLRFLEPPDGDAGFHAFRAMHSQYEWVSGNLLQVRYWVRESVGVITLDNFLGHLAAYEGKPVVWINGGSNPHHVRPYGPLTRIAQVEPMACRPCHNRCHHPEFKACLKSLDASTVNAALRPLLASQD